MKKLNKEININKKFIILLILVNILVIGLYYSYALFEISVIQDNVVVLKTGTIEPITTTITGYEDATLTLAAGETKSLTVNLETTNTTDIGYKMYYEILSGNSTFEVTSSGDVEGIMNTSKTIRLYFTNTGSESIIIKLGTQGGLKEYEVVLTQGAKLILTPSIAQEIVLNTVSYSVASARDFSGALVAINGTEGNDYGLLYNENDDTHTIREYRYSGADVDNYIYYNCPDTANAKNYGDLDYDYENNCEVWRIVGIFYENGEQFLKIMNNNTLTDIPATYVYDDTTYTVGNNGTKAYWNNPDTLKSTQKNDWTTAGLQYYLNTEQDKSETPVAGYLSRLSTNAKNLIRETTYYLGNVDYDVNTVKLSYEHERDETRIWIGNKLTWTGKVGLLYPSDYGYSTIPAYWSNTKIRSLAKETTWMMQTANHSLSEWFLSPSYNQSNHTILWTGAGGLNYYLAGVASGVRPVLNLKSNTKVLKGDGDVNSPYVVIEI